PLPPRSTLFPYTTLFRSQRQQFSLKENTELQSCQQLVWDLQQISHIDSAGFALLTELLLLNPAEKVRLINLPEQCKNLAALFSLDRKSTRLNSSHVSISY